MNAQRSKTSDCSCGVSSTLLTVVVLLLLLLSKATSQGNFERQGTLNLKRKLQESVELKSDICIQSSFGFEGLEIANRKFGVDRYDDLVYYDNSRRPFDKLWSAGIKLRTRRLCMQGDGNLVAYGAVPRSFNHVPIWSTETQGNPGAKLILSANRDGGGTGLSIVSTSGETLWTLDDEPLRPEIRCLDRPVPSNTRMERYDMICDGSRYFGIDGDGWVASHGNVTKRDDFIYPYMNIYFKPADYGYFQSDGNFVAYTKDGEPVWSSRTNVGYPKDFIDYRCNGEFCNLFFSSEDGNAIPWEPKSMYCRFSIMRAGDRLDTEEFMCSPDAATFMGLSDRSRLYIGRSSAIGGRNRFFQETYTYSNFLVMQDDGNLVWYDFERNPLWASGTDGNLGAYAEVKNDGTVGVYTSVGDLLVSL